MIILDTNVVSEPMRPNGDPAVLAWLDRQAAETLYLTSTSLTELLTGIEILPGGRRKKGLGDALNELLAVLFEERMLPFDTQAAIVCASLTTRARAAGRQVSFADAQIGAIAEVHGFAVASRDTALFEAFGIPVINPWAVG